MSCNNLEEEAARLTELLHGKQVKVIYRHGETELVIIFVDETRLFIDSNTCLDFSITG